MTVTKLKIRVKFIEPVLGTCSADPEVHAKFIASKAETPGQAKEEVEAIDVEEEIKNAVTVFPKDEKGLFLWDYQLKGFFKENIGMLVELGAANGLSKWSFRRAVDQFLYVHPRRVYLMDPATGMPWTESPKIIQRPIRVITMQGERVALASSESLPPETWFDFEVHWLSGDNTKTKMAVFDKDLIIRALDLGMLKGTGQWRNASNGRFTYEVLEG